VIYANVFTIGWASNDAGCQSRLQDLLRRMEVNGHVIVSVSIVAFPTSVKSTKTGVQKEYEVYVISRLHRLLTATRQAAEQAEQASDGSRSADQPDKASEHGD
jgi:hypothetical protein